MKSIHARDNGHFESEICPIITQDGSIAEDGCIRDTSLESMSKLRPVFREDGSVTAATSSPLTDGAVCMLVCSSDFAEKNGLEPLARIVTSAVTGCSPDAMGIGPVSATQKLLERSDWNIDDVDIFEINDFANTAIARIRCAGGPEFVECQTYRWREHCGPHFDNDLGYRSDDEVNAWMARDPIALAASSSGCEQGRAERGRKQRISGSRQRT